MVRIVKIDRRRMSPAECEYFVTYAFRDHNKDLGKEQVAT